MAAFNTLSYYLVAAFVPTYLESFVKVDHATAMLVATVASAFNVAWVFFRHEVPILAGCPGGWPSLRGGFRGEIPLGLPSPTAC